METSLNFKKEGNEIKLIEENIFDEDGIRDLFQSFKRNWSFMLENKLKTQEAITMNQNTLKRIESEEEVTRSRLESIISFAGEEGILLDLDENITEWLNDKKNELKKE